MSNWRELLSPKALAIVGSLRGSIVAGLDYESDDWDMGQGEEGAATRAHEEKVDALITAVCDGITEAGNG